MSYLNLEKWKRENFTYFFNFIIKIKLNQFNKPNDNNFKNYIIKYIYS